VNVLSRSNPTVSFQLSKRFTNECTIADIAIVFTAAKTRPSKRRVGKAGRRWYKDVGLGFKTPRTAIEGTYIDKKCTSPVVEGMRTGN
jgi:hypothetical protein